MWAHPVTGEHETPIAGQSSKPQGGPTMDIRRHLIGGLLAGAVIAPAMVQADAPAPKWYDKLTLGGYVASDYELWINQPQASDNNATVPFRAFDGKANTFDYTGELTLAYADTASGTSSNVDLLYGALGNAITGNNYGPTLSIGQAYISQAFGPLTLDLGKFATPVGYESWNVTANANFSRSLTYTLEPFFQTGLKLDYAGPGGFGANLWVDEGNSVDPYTNGNNDNGKGWGVALSYSGIKNLALNAQFYSSDANLYANNTGLGGPWFDTNDMIDFNAAYTLNDSLSFAFEYLYDTMLDGGGTAPFGFTMYPYSPKVNSLAGYVTYNTPVKNLSVAGRYEHVNSPDQGVFFWSGTANGSNVGFPALAMDSYTVTVKYAMGPVTDILEYRADAASDYNQFTTSNGTATQVDSTVTLAATYGF
jgi:hypothetical protein